jgi:5'(3')-deoxyribonucleotidase
MSAAWEIYLDVDGVCADFIGPALSLVKLDPKAVLARWASEFQGDFYPQALLGMPRQDFFLEIDRHGAGFWRDLPAYPWFKDLHQGLAQHGQVLFLTAPTGYPDCLAGKYQWLCDRFGKGFDDCIFTSHKARLAHSRAILIDDSDANIRQFCDRGGHGVVFPQVWNSAGACEDPLQAVLQAVTKLVQDQQH